MKVYVMMFNDVPKCTFMDLTTAEKHVIHQIKQFKMARRRDPNRKEEVIWIKEVGEEEPAKKEVQWWVTSKVEGEESFPVRTRKEAREFIRWGNSNEFSGTYKLERREYGLFKSEVVS